MVGCQSSRCDLVRGSTSCSPGLVRAHCELSESACIVAVILSEASCAIPRILSEPSISFQSPHGSSSCCCQRLVIVSRWSCQSPPSVIRVRAYTLCDPVRGFSCYLPGLVRAHRKLPKSTRIPTMFFVWTHSQSVKSRYVFHQLPF